MVETRKIAEVKKEVGQLMKLLRKRQKLTQTKLADRIDVSRNTIKNLESGKNFTIDTLLIALKEFDMLDVVYQEVLKHKQDIIETKSLY